jgi:acetyl esterase/lipase
MQQILENAMEWYQADPKDTVLIGDSADATLCCVISLMARDRGGLAAQRQILVYPAAFGDYRAYREGEKWEYSEKTPFASVVENGTDYLLTLKKLKDYMALYTSCEEDYRHPYFAPLNHSDLSGLPQTLLITMEYDPLRDEGRLLAAKMKEAGTPVHSVMIHNGVHGMFSLPPSTPLTRQIYRHIKNFIPIKEDVITDYVEQSKKQMETVG